MIKTFSAFLLICTVEFLTGAIAVATPVSSDVPVQAASQPTTTIKIIAPNSNQVIDLPSTSITVAYPIDAQIELQVNGVAVDDSLIGRTETDTTNKLITQTWYGVSLEQGENAIVAVPTTPGLAPATIKVQVRGGVKKITLQTEAARIPADGRSTTTIQGQLIDANGNRTNQNAVVTLAASAGEFVEKDVNPTAPGFQVQAKQGQFSTTLRSGLEAKTVTIRAAIADIEAFTQLQFETDLRPSIATGVIDVRLGRGGTDFYQSFREFLPPDDNKTKLDIYGAAFATGKVGEWLFTGAYNSDRTLNRDCNGRDRLFRDTQPCEQAYPTYGDNSQVTALTPSQDSLYLRFERSPQILNAEPDYAMWGDFDTQEFARTSQQFSATTRQLHGFKANYNWGNLQITGFYGNNVQGFQRDAIAPDGTSGYYFLSRRLLFPGSENVFIELEELNRPGTVLSRQQLTRGIDYDIDYDRGTLFFRQPILRTDVDQTGQVLVRRIIATYQYESQENGRNTIYGGRLQYHISRQLNQESWIGATYLQENQGVRDFELYGADASIALGEKTRLIAEYAHSNNDSELLGAISGSAYRLEAIAEIAQGIRASAYFRTADTGFANNATISFVPGQTRYGAQVVGKLSPQTNLRLQYDREVNQGIAPEPLRTFEDLFTPRVEPIPGSRVDNSLTTILAGVEQRIGKANVTVDWIHRQREDRIAPNALSGTSNQLRSRLTLPLTDNLTFLAQNELSFSDRVDAVYPDRTILGLDWGLLPGVNLRLAQQFYTRGQFAGNSITSVEVVGEHKFSQNTILTGRYSIFGGLNDFSGQGAIGLKHRWDITPSLKLNLAYERIFGDFFGRTAAGLQFAQPFAPGQSAASLGFGAGNSYSIGLEYNPSSDFQANARYEHRTSPSGSNTVIGANVTGKISPALTALVRYQQANFSNQQLAGLGNTVNFKAGLAYRDPYSDKFNALLRYEYRKNPATIPDTLLLGTGTGYEEHTFALEALYAPNWQWEFYGKYALRNSTSYLATDLVGTSTINLAQLRATYRLSYSVDLVGEARWIHQPTTGFSETGFVVEAGYYLTPNLRLSAGYAFGDVSDRDFSGSRSSGGAYLGLTVKLNELFDGFGLQKPVPAPPKTSPEVVSSQLRNKLKQSHRNNQHPQAPDNTP
ncbi:invasin domain 3-containing protein [Chroococcidiopsis sp. TS-821]|uniref:invasin domain 3-containing protein n=1 Tax=Chroococcidiopsis sp. TS-821 TaxID=1378066 RepID=UPI000CEEB3B4|nr:invasin domain 3-containing protein [Chroococcidiopsis sp. TS-821]PPS43280.1 hypothetical protein B1A85_11290 [Chroococcidiopsis sp. TS-821]